MSESKIVQHIDVDVPANIAYNQWTQFEQFPRFMEGVEQVEQLTDDTVRFTVAVGPKKLTYVAEIVDQQPDRRIVWRTVGGKENVGMVTFEPLDDRRTRIGLLLRYEVAGIAEQLGDALGFVEGRAKGDLKNFKAFIESRRQPTGAWRGSL